MLDCSSLQINSWCAAVSKTLVKSQAASDVHVLQVMLGQARQEYDHMV